MTYSDKHQRTTSSLFNNVNGNKGSHKILGTVTGGQQLGKAGTAQTDLGIEIRSLKYVN
jgi:hypothetical protein